MTWVRTLLHAGVSTVEVICDHVMFLVYGEVERVDETAVIVLVLFWRFGVSLGGGVQERNSENVRKLILRLRFKHADLTWPIQTR
jgi:hypothetical protein